jgi:hypothetical protein
MSEHEKDAAGGQVQDVVRPPDADGTQSAQRAEDKCVICGEDFIHPEVVFRVNGQPTCSPDCMLELAMKPKAV